MQNVLSKKELDREKKKNVILDEVELLLREKSFDELTMDEVAERTAISKGALYLLFASKKELSLAVHNRGLEYLADRFANVFAEDLPGIELLKKMGSEYMSFMMQNPRYLETFIQNEVLLFSHPQVLGKQCDISQELNQEAQKCFENATKMFAYLNRCIQVAQSDKSIHYSGDSKELALIYWGGVRGLFQIAYLSKKGFVLPSMEGASLDFESLLTSFFDLIDSALIKNDQ